LVKKIAFFVRPECSVACGGDRSHEAIFFTENAMDDFVVEADGLVKRYNGFTAVNGIDLRIRRGECFGFLGPNGAGKTTTIRMIHCFTPVTEGRLRVFGLDALSHARAIKSRIGVCPQEDNLDIDFSVRKNLLVFSRYFGIPKQEAEKRADELIRFVDLAPRSGAHIRELSAGMKRRLIIARALINKPEMLILDEPTTGLDPQARHQIWERVRNLKKGGATILLTTHYMEEASQLCDRLVIVDSGKIIAGGEPDALIAEHIARDVIEIEDPPEALVGELAAAGRRFEKMGARLFIHSPDGDGEGIDLARRFGLEHIQIRRATLEDVFLKLTGREIRG
jgi:lipooligosaccharide transport system ATP-binding protein